MKFKNIIAHFSVAEDTAFKEGRWDKDRSDMIFEVNRHLSGCTAYGDRSGHAVTITNRPESMPHYLDTRYDRIPTKKQEWINFWRDWIEREYSLILNFIDYKESEEEVNED